jgi:hypothetical protein
MVCHLMRDADAGDVPNVALVEVNEWDGMITLFRAGVWAMERRFLTGNPADRLAEREAEKPSDFGQLLLEMGRAFQYFKQQFRNEIIGRILVYGTSHNIQAVCEALQTSFDLQVSSFSDTRKLFDTGVASSKESQAGAVALYSIPCSVALHGRFAEYIDFLPERLRERGRTISKRLVVSTFAFALYCWLVTVWWMVSREAARVLLETQANPANLTAIDKQGDRMQRLIDLRSFALAGLKSQQWLQEKHKAPGALVRELAELAPRQMKITSFQALERGEGWDVNLTGEIRSQNGTYSQELLGTFRSQSRTSPYLSELRLSDVEVSDVGSTGTGSSPESGPKKNLLNFSMAGYLTRPASRKG